MTSVVFVVNSDDQPSLHFFPGEVDTDVLGLLVDTGLVQAEVLDVLQGLPDDYLVDCPLSDRTLSKHSTPVLDRFFECVIDWDNDGKTEEELNYEEELDYNGTPVDLTVMVEYHNEPISPDGDYAFGSITYHLNQ